MLNAYFDKSLKGLKILKKKKKGKIFLSGICLFEVSLLSLLYFYLKLIITIYFIHPPDNALICWVKLSIMCLEQERLTRRKKKLGVDRKKRWRLSKRSSEVKRWEWLCMHGNNNVNDFILHPFSFYFYFFLKSYLVILKQANSDYGFVQSNVLPYHYMNYNGEWKYAIFITRLYRFI